MKVSFLLSTLVGLSAVASAAPTAESPELLMKKDINEIQSPKRDAEAAKSAFPYRSFQFGKRDPEAIETVEARKSAFPYRSFQFGKREVETVEARKSAFPYRSFQFGKREVRNVETVA